MLPRAPPPRAPSKKGRAKDRCFCGFRPARPDQPDDLARFSIGACTPPLSGEARQWLPEAMNFPAIDPDAPVEQGDDGESEDDLPAAA
jgi:hypothetical protein